MPPEDQQTSRDAAHRWRAMQVAVGEATARPAELMEAVGRAGSRPEAITAVAQLLQIDDTLASNVLDLRLWDFLGQSRD